MKKVSPKTCLVVYLFAGNHLLDPGEKREGEGVIIVRVNVTYCNRSNIGLARCTYLSKTEDSNCHKLLFNDI